MTLGGRRIAKLRKAQRLSQRALADHAKALALNLSYSTLENYEGNVTVPRLAEVVALADVLDGSLDILPRGDTYRILPLRNLTKEQIQLLLDLSACFRRQNSSDQERKSPGPTKEQVVLFARMIKEILGGTAPKATVFAFVLLFLHSCCFFRHFAFHLVI